MRFWLAALIALLVAGCAAVPTRPVVDSAAVWASRRADLITLNAWDIKGRVGVRSGPKSGQATVIWERRDDAHSIKLFGPLGGGLVQLTQDASGAQLRDSKNKVYTAASAQDVLLDSTGWTIPFDDLKYWLAGVPAPGSADELRIDDFGRLEFLRQSGWEIRFIEYEQQARHELPRKVFLQRMPLSSRDVEVRVVIKRWGFEL